MEKITNCPICLYKNIYSFPDYGMGSVFYECPVCGRFELSEIIRLDKNKLASYLFYNRFDSKLENELRYHTTLSKEDCDRYNEEYNDGKNTNGRPVHMDEDVLNSWYPNSFAERIDRILQLVYCKTKHIGEHVTFSIDETYSLLFVDRFEHNKDEQFVHRDEEDYTKEAHFIFDYLTKQELIDFFIQDYANIVLLPKGLSRVDEIERSAGTGREVLVAMQFGEETIQLRESIKQGIRDAGYIPVLVDEVEHNNFITPEILSYIKKSKFIVVDLTYQNNGAYFEEGYAMGLGKPVIQLCRDGEKLHFDIAQKNTIMWKTEDDIPLRLANRIKATID